VALQTPHKNRLAGPHKLHLLANFYFFNCPINNKCIFHHPARRAAKGFQRTASCKALKHWVTGQGEAPNKIKSQSTKLRKIPKFKKAKIKTKALHPLQIWTLVPGFIWCFSY